jgi:hypothetical protein
MRGCAAPSAANKKFLGSDRMHPPHALNMPAAHLLSGQTRRCSLEAQRSALRLLAIDAASVAHFLSRFLKAGQFVFCKQFAAHIPHSEQRFRILLRAKWNTARTRRVARTFFNSSKEIHNDQA